MRIKLTPSYHWTSPGAIYSKSVALPCLDLHCLVVHCLALHCHSLRRPSHTKPCHATPCHALLCLVLPCLPLTRGPNAQSVQRWHRKLHNRPDAQVPHHLQLWPLRLPKSIKIDTWRHKCPITSKSGPGDLKIDPWRPKCSLPQNLALETSKIV